jgi:hypothetical protein
MDFDMDFEVKKLKAKKAIEDKCKLEEDLINNEYKLKCEAIDNKIKELQFLKKVRLFQEYKKALLEHRTKYNLNGQNK